MDDVTQISSPAGEENLKLVTSVSTLLEENARRSRRIGHVFIATTLIIGASILVLFLVYTQISTQYAYERTIDERRYVYDRELELMSRLSDTYAKLRSGQNTGESDQTNKQISDLVDSLKDRINDESTRSRPNLTEEVVSNAVSSVIRIGAVLIGIFLIQILVVLARYYYRMSDHFEMSAAIVLLAGGKISNVKILSPLLLPAKIDFGKSPTSPVERVFDGTMGTIKELAKKIPTH
jgi:predicted PurR-regulated permease PerM